MALADVAHRARNLAGLSVEDASGAKVGGGIDGEEFHGKVVVQDKPGPPEFFRAPSVLPDISPTGGRLAFI